jgi:HEAT repeat protein
VRALRTVSEEEKRVVAEGILANGFLWLERGGGKRARKSFDRVRKAGLSEAMTLVATRGVILSDPDSGIGLLTGLIRSPDRARYEAGVELARELHGEGVRRALVKLLPKLGMPQQGLLAEVMGVEGNWLALPALLELAESGEGASRLSALRALANYPDHRGIGLLLVTAMGSDEVMSAAARDALVRMPDEADTLLAAQLLRADEQRTVLVLEVLARRGRSAAQDVVIPLVSDPSPAVRLAALGALGACATASSWTTLVSCLLQAELRQEREAAHAALLAAMGRLADKRICGGALVTALPSAPEPTRSLVIDLLGRTGDTNVVSALLPYATSDTPEPTRGNARRAVDGLRDGN